MMLRLLAGLGWLGYLAGCLLILENSIVDFRPGGAGLFIREKAAIGGDPLWRLSLHLHVGGGLLCLFAALPQFSRRLLRRLPALHRVAGRLYALAMLAIVCPTGAHLALHAKGGLAGQLGFLLLGAIGFHSTLAAWRAVLPPHRDLAAHRAWMLRSFATASSAVSFRVLHIVGHLAGLEATTNYVACLWLSLLGNLAVAEWLIRRTRSSPSSPSIPTELPTKLQTEP